MTQGASVLDPRGRRGQAVTGEVCHCDGLGSGHGRATVRRFVEEGAAVMIVDRHQPGAERVRDELRDYGGQAEMYIGDIGNPESAKELMATTKEQFGRIDILVNNVGGGFQTAGQRRNGLGEDPGRLDRQRSEQPVHLPVVLLGSGPDND